MDHDELIDRYLAAEPHSRSGLEASCLIPATPGAYGRWLRYFPAAIDVSRPSARVIERCFTPASVPAGRLGTEAAESAEYSKRIHTTS